MPSTDVLQPETIVRRGFTAPPPTPIGPANHRSNIVNEDALATFLESSLRIPDLLLPPQPKANKDDNDPEKISFSSVDLERLRTGNEQEKELPMQTVVQIAAESGAFQLINHGIPLSLIKRLKDECYHFFAMPTEHKRAAALQCSHQHDLLPSYLCEASTSEQNAVAPNWEIFCSGYDRDMMANSAYKSLPEDCQHFGATVFEYMEAVEQLATEVLQLLTGGSWEKVKMQYRSVLCICYQQSGASSQIETNHSHPHMFSVQCYDEEGCVHLISDNGTKSTRSAVGSLVITIGEILQVWSEGKYKSVHVRPIALPEKPCLSASFFLVPHD